MPFKIITYSILVISSILLFFSLFQNAFIYEKSLAKFSHNYDKREDGIVDSKIPFVKVEESNFIHWDVLAYNKLKNDLYTVPKGAANLNFAFFPLFPMIWKVSGLSAKYIGFLNYAFFTVGIIFLALSFSADFIRNSNVKYLLLILLPTNIVFLIPYSEALFFLTFSIAIWGFVKDKPAVLFIALFLNATTRSSGNIILLSMLAVDLIYFFRTRYNFEKVKKAILFRYMPILLGITSVALIQKYYGSPSFFYFFSVQKEFWELYLSWPEKIFDWSKEGFSMNYGVVFIVIVPLLIYVFRSGLSVVFRNISFPKEDGNDENARLEFVFFLSAIYIVANFLLTVLFRHGSINTLFRYTLSTPFFFFICIQFEKYCSINLIKKLIVNLTTLVLAIYLIKFIPYATYISYQWIGFILLYAFSFLYLLQKYSKSIFYNVCLGLYAIISVIWQAYLFNVYLSNGWIFL